MNILINQINFSVEKEAVRYSGEAAGSQATGKHENRAVHRRVSGGIQSEPTEDEPDIAATALVSILI